jgi:prevent-host-death family protein
MQAMGIREFRDTLTTAIRRVEAGERLAITRDGAVVAYLVPAAAGDRLDELVAQGRARPPRHALRLPGPPRTSTVGRSTAETIAEDRDA